MISIFRQIHCKGTPGGCGINWSVVQSDLHRRGCPICHTFGVDAEAAIMHHTIRLSMVHVARKHSNPSLSKKNVYCDQSNLTRSFLCPLKQS